MKRTLLVIDPQNDFCDPKGALYVPGAEKDMDRLAAFLTKNMDKIDEVRVTLDSHHPLHIAHPVCWVDEKGNHPNPFTMITLADVEGQNPKWRAYNPKWRTRYIDYVKALQVNGRYDLMIWPPHCLIGSWGHGIYPAFSDALIEYANKEFATVEFVTKGGNLFTENYSAVQADVPDNDDPDTGLKTDFIDSMVPMDEILTAGEASSHCLKDTMKDIAARFGDDQVKKFTLLTDCTSPVPNPPGTTLFTDAEAAFIKEMTGKGMKTIKSTDF